MAIANIVCRGFGPSASIAAVVTAGYAITAAAAKDIGVPSQSPRWRFPLSSPPALRHYQVTTLHRWITDVYVGGQAQTAYRPAPQRSYAFRPTASALEICGAARGTAHRMSSTRFRHIPMEGMCLVFSGSSSVRYLDYVREVVEPDDADVLALML